MPSFDMAYDEDDDVLEVTFHVFDEKFARTIQLNDHIFAFTDLSLGAVWGLTFYSFSRILQVSETELTGLRDLPESQSRAFLRLLACPPAGHFFDLTDPGALIARVRAPAVHDLVTGE